MEDLEDIIILPKSYPSEEEQSSIVKRYRTLRLTGLKEDPDAFTSTYEAELQFPRERWLARVTNPDVQTLIVVERDLKIAKPNLLNDWVGTVTFHGPKLILRDTLRSHAPWKIFLHQEEYVPPPNGSPVDAMYMLTGMLVIREARRKGHSRRMIEKVVENIRSKADEMHTDRVVVFALVYAKNKPYMNCTQHVDLKYGRPS